jgi:hypothetical protein
MTRPAELLRHSRLRGLAHCSRPVLVALALGLACMFAGAVGPTSALAASPLAWSTPDTLPTSVGPSAVACASESLCVTVDHEGNALSTSDPTSSAPTWSSASIDPGESLNAVSCAPGGPCVAVDGHGYAFVSAGSGASSWSPAPIDGGKALTGVSCPSASLCVAVDGEGDVLTSVKPATAGTWTLASTHAGHHLVGVSCSSPTLCVAIDSGGYVLATSEPRGTEWSTREVDPVELLAVSCWEAGSCVALDSAGDALASTDPTAKSATWSLTAIEEGGLTGISCASSGLCVAVDGSGQALASDNAATSAPSWSTSNADSHALTGVSCLPGGFCMAVDTGPSSVGGRVPPPAATTSEKTTVTDESATLTGAVDPNDAGLGACSFEYGTTPAYGQSIPCSVTPVAVGGIQDVSAQATGLSANTTYHYRVIASSPAGTSAGADETFKTEVSAQIAIVHPNPSISGTPAVGQKLTCKAGTPVGTSPKLSYTWLRDQVPIAGADGSTYLVKGQDSGHHLQCEVTATDGGGSAGALSAFVTIPVGGVPASAGETTVGKAVFKNGKVSVPISCSTLAGASCEVTLRVTAVETLSGSRVVAVAARTESKAHGRAAASHHKTITLASVRVRVARGAHVTLSAALSPGARRLLASRRRFTAYAAVRGTVVGLIEAQLARQLLTLTAPSHATKTDSASTHVARRG